MESITEGATVPEQGEQEWKVSMKVGEIWSLYFLHVASGEYALCSA